MLARVSSRGALTPLAPLHASRYGAFFSRVILSGYTLERNIGAWGGAAFVDDMHGNSTLVNCKYLNNLATNAGGAVAVQFSNRATRTTMWGGTMSGNCAAVAGGALFGWLGHVKLEQVTVATNRAGDCSLAEFGALISSLANSDTSVLAAGEPSGGGLAFSLGSAILTDVAVVGNVAASNKGSVIGQQTNAIGGGGGGIACAGCAINASRLRVHSNHAYARGGGAMCMTAGKFVWRNATVYNNTAAPNGDGGGLLLIDCKADIQDSSFTSNHVAGVAAGGGVFVGADVTPASGPWVQLRGVTIRNNTAEAAGGGLAVATDPTNATCAASATACLQSSVWPAAAAVTVDNIDAISDNKAAFARDVLFSNRHVQGWPPAGGATAVQAAAAGRLASSPIGLREVDGYTLPTHVGTQQGWDTVCLQLIDVYGQAVGPSTLLDVSPAEIAVEVSVAQASGPVVAEVVGGVTADVDTATGRACFRDAAGVNVLAAPQSSVLLRFALAPRVVGVADLLRAVEIDACGAGTQSAGDRCEPCTRGTHAPGVGTTCQACTAGTYQDATGASSCKTPAAGWVALSPGAHEPTRCSAGFYEVNRSACKPCAAGFAASFQGAHTCGRCGPGTKSVGGVTCEQCPANTCVAFTPHDRVVSRPLSPPQPHSAAMRVAFAAGLPTALARVASSAPPKGWLVPRVF